MSWSQGVGPEAMTSRHGPIITSWPAPIYNDVTAKTANPGSAPVGTGSQSTAAVWKVMTLPTQIDEFHVELGSRTHTNTHKHTQTHAYMCTLKNPPACTDQDDSAWYQSSAHRVVLIISICWSLKQSAWSPADKHILRYDSLIWRRFKRSPCKRV